MRLYFKELCTVLTHKKPLLDISFCCAVDDDEDGRHEQGQEDEEKLSKSVK